MYINILWTLQGLLQNLTYPLILLQFLSRAALTRIPLQHLIHELQKQFLIRAFQKRLQFTQSNARSALGMLVIVIDGARYARAQMRATNTLGFVP